MTNQLANAGVDLGESIEPPKEELSTNLNAINSQTEDKDKDQDKDKDGTSDSTVSDVNDKKNYTDGPQNDVENGSEKDENDIKVEKASNLENDKPPTGDSSVENKTKVSEEKNKEKAIKPSKALKSTEDNSKDKFEEIDTAKDKKSSKKSKE